MRRLPVGVLLSLLGASLLAPAGAAHAAPDPPEWMTRLLHDYNDDWGSDASHTSLRDGHDLIALDLREEYNKTFAEDTLVFRLSMNYGYDADTTKPELRDVVSFKVKGQAVSREFKTADNTKFTSTFDAVYGPVALRAPDGRVDGTRVYVEGLLKFSTLGLAAGDKLTEFFVQGYGGSQKGDHMVGGNVLSNGESPAEQSGPTSYRKNDYTLRGPVMYARSALDKSSVDAKPSDNKTITWSITNTLGRAQSFTITTAAPSGIEIGLHSGRFATGTLSIQVPAGTSATVHVYVLAGDSAKSGDLDLTLSTDLGGRFLHHVDVTIGAGATSPSTSGAAAPSSNAGSSPALNGVWALLLVVIIASAVRRRSA